ncbi:hypothetical protein E8E13_006573 [Curvularia kusanoi]|uniref:Uncharacterized protein n=1 Tax=Curvularia kusanoi TaxID=90978 RepID=A0A9P4TD91_CURKU|nr:hypothetical protein E8E13_006573 [Curvularia kusanoi]
MKLLLLLTLTSLTTASILTGLTGSNNYPRAPQKCGGGCVFSKQCATYDKGNTDCRCSWL